MASGRGIGNGPGGKLKRENFPSVRSPKRVFRIPLVESQITFGGLGSFEQLFAHQNLPNVIFEEPYLPQPVDIGELLTSILEQSNGPLETEAPLEKPHFVNDVLSGSWPIREQM
jgi:hypothetical protein